MAAVLMRPRAQWQEGDYALLIHLFGGIGGENKELTPAGTVTGHFAYGLARVVKEPIAQELQFNIQYQQIYAHNSGGIVSGTQDWSSYSEVWHGAGLVYAPSPMW
jgi:predicted Abi (CAAX) family protease